jgi:hypothetical protein
MAIGCGLFNAPRHVVNVAILLRRIELSVRVYGGGMAAVFFNRQRRQEIYAIAENKTWPDEFSLLRGKARVPLDRLPGG